MNERLSTFGVIVCSIVTMAVLYGFGRLLYWAYTTQGYLAGIGMTTVLALIVYSPWIVAALLRDLRKR